MAGKSEGAKGLQFLIEFTIFSGKLKWCRATEVMGAEGEGRVRETEREREREREGERTQENRVARSENRDETSRAIDRSKRGIRT
jgi:hypothetical protein